MQTVCFCEVILRNNSKSIKKMNINEKNEILFNYLTIWNLKLLGK